MNVLASHQFSTVVTSGLKDLSSEGCTSLCCVSSIECNERLLCSSIAEVLTPCLEPCWNWPSYLRAMLNRQLTSSSFLAVRSHYFNANIRSSTYITSTTQTFAGKNPRNCHRALLRQPSIRRPCPTSRLAPTSGKDISGDLSVELSGLRCQAFLEHVWLASSDTSAPLPLPWAHKLRRKLFIPLFLC